MNATHRKTVARAVTERTGETYQQALTRVIDLTQDRRLPLDPTGRQQLVDLLVDQYLAPAGQPTGQPTTEAPSTPPSVPPSTPPPAVCPADLITVDLITALNHLGALLACGLPPTDALSAVAECSQDPTLADGLRGTADELRGVPSPTLAEAFATQPALNHPVLLAYARAGGFAGDMNGSLTRAATLFENDLRLNALRRSGR